MWLFNFSEVLFKHLKLEEELYTSWMNYAASYADSKMPPNPSMRHLMALMLFTLSSKFPLRLVQSSVHWVELSEEPWIKWSLLLLSVLGLRKTPLQSSAPHSDLFWDQTAQIKPCSSAPCLFSPLKSAVICGCPCLEIPCLEIGGINFVFLEVGEFLLVSELIWISPSKAAPSAQKDNTVLWLWKQPVDFFVCTFEVFCSFVCFLFVFLFDYFSWFCLVWFCLHTITYPGNTKKKTLIPFSLSGSFWLF